MHDLSSFVTLATQAISTAKNLAELEQLRINYLGKKSELTQLLKSVGQLSPEERPKLGEAVNIAKEKIQESLAKQKAILENQQLLQNLSKEKIDITLPGRGESLGSLHPLMQQMDRMISLFSTLGFSIQAGPDIESEYYNFDALNMPSTHPARGMQDTFYLENYLKKNKLLLRTQTSPVQIRFMQQHTPPLRMIAPGRVYRRDFDATHSPMFHQVEGLVIDKNINFANLKHILIEFLQAFFEKIMPIRFRPSYFPFTEPSAEIDIQCVMCEGKGCSVCKHTGWLEILGAGMVHPHVLAQGNIDPKQYTGYAFGMGIERLTMLYYGIDDLRILFENDLKFLKQF